MACVFVGSPLGELRPDTVAIEVLRVFVVLVMADPTVCASGGSLFVSSCRCVLRLLSWIQHFVSFRC
jgi:hypothetical protein